MTLPTREQLEAHTRKYGSEGILETAVELGWDVKALAQLIESLDKIEAERDSRRRFSQWKKPRLSAEKRARRLLGIPEEEGGEQAA